jgi:farnesyl diphosphate synthase
VNDTKTSALHADALEQVSKRVDNFFDVLLTAPDDARAKLFYAMRYAAIGGGKRLRPLLVHASSQLFSVDPLQALRAGAAVEAVHVYSLIHDDLPSMDDDDLRRGKPTVHRAFDEATAILAGDALHALAFEILTDDATHPDPLVRIELCEELARASGPNGMAGGQMMDLAAESGQFDLETVSRLQHLKTGALICWCIEAGAILGRVPPDDRLRLQAFARNIGLAFQITDDLIDAEGDPTLVGKAVGKDDAAGKETFVSLMGIERARAKADALVDQAIENLADFGAQADLLRAIAVYVVERKH